MAPPAPVVAARPPVPEPVPHPPAPLPAAAKTVEVPWSAPPPPRVAPPPAPPAPAPPAPAPAPEPGLAPAPESASGELTSATLAELYFKQGFPEKAIEVYRQLVQREPDNDRLRRRLAELQDSPSPAASRRLALERTIARLEGMLAAIKKG
jgi:hypothetical protein